MAALQEAGNREGGWYMIDQRVQSLCEEYGIEAIEGSAYPKLGQTRAVATIQKLLDKSEDDARMVMLTLAETSGNKACLDSVGLWTTFFLVRKYRREIDADPSFWLKTWDEMPVGYMQALSQELGGTFHQKDALGGMLHWRLRRPYGQQDFGV